MPKLKEGWSWEAEPDVISGSDECRELMSKKCKYSHLPSLDSRMDAIIADNQDLFELCKFSYSEDVKSYSDGITSKTGYSDNNHKIMVAILKVCKGDDPARVRALLFKKLGAE